MRKPMIAALAVAIAATAALAQQGAKPSPAEMKKQFYEMANRASAPTEAHKALSVFTGTFDQVSEVTLGQQMSFSAESRATGAWIMGGRFVKVESRGTGDEDSSGERITVYGFDTASQKYTLWTIESFNTGSASAEGSYNPETKTFEFKGERTGPGGTMVPFHWNVAVKDGGVLDQTIDMKFPGAKDFSRMVHVTHTPAKK